MKGQKTLGTLYELLEVQPTASIEVIKAAHKARLSQADPELVEFLDKAKEILTDSAKRTEYDCSLSNYESGLLGNYQVLQKIGEGGFGATYKAKHVVLDKLACLKQNNYISPADTELILNEAKLLWNINHYSLPTVKDFFKISDGSCVLAMTYIEGPNLEEIVKKQGGLHPEHVCWMTQRLLNGLHYLHYHGIVHCDVKPNNIIIKPEDHNAILVDYGYASLRPKIKTTPKGYTEIFAAPELLELLPPIPETDLYSLAKTMIYALGGDPVEETYPRNTRVDLRDFFNQFLKHNPIQRPSWEKRDFVKDLSNLRYRLFGRRSSNRELKV